MEPAVVIPIYHEETNIPALCQRLCIVLGGTSSGCKLIFINQGTHDHSRSGLLELAARDEHVRYIALSRNFGHRLAVTAASDWHRGGAVSITNANLPAPPEPVPLRYAKLAAGYEVAHAKRPSGVQLIFGSTIGECIAGRSANVRQRRHIVFRTNISL